MLKLMVYLKIQSSINHSSQTIDYHIAHIKTLQG